MPIDDDVELDTEKQEAPKKKSALKKIILFSLIGLLLMGGTGAGLYFAGMLPFIANHSEDEVASAEQDDKKGKKGKKEKKKEELKPAVYFAFDPPFVVNFQEQTHARFLQVTIEVMARDPLVIENIKTHTPLIRNNLLMLLSDQTYESVSTRTGKEKIRADSLAEIQKVMKQETGESGVEAIYFTSFVMQ